MAYFHVHSIPGVSWLKVESCRWRWKPGYSYNRTFDGSLFWFLCHCCLDFSSDHLMSHNTGSQPYYTGSGHILGHTRSQPYHTGSYKVPTILFAAGFLWQSRNSLHLLRCRRNQVIQTYSSSLLQNSYLWSPFQRTWFKMADIYLSNVSFCCCKIYWCFQCEGPASTSLNATSSWR